ncbi:hypothetical protein M407DRAFT_17039 [Tulasnella calospora MUT 4182]|uniref:Uncharacterized protein n=1 Tax=Tulasnella calospora MUT 4182 TaxID=1051891 RepID=A0A0C3QY59_9AGAM|nr:hypothetical protein M407DRAFT_17039 [Tulasnella calospora MUT 4182]
MATLKELPGFYYDPVKKRYFPGKRPPAPSTPAPTATARSTVTGDMQAAHAKQARRGSTYQSLARLKANPFAYGARRRFQTQAQDRIYGSTSLCRSQMVPHSSPLVALAVSPDSRYMTAVNDKGALYTYQEIAEPSVLYSNSWREEMILPGEVTSVGMAGMRYVVTSLNPRSQILIGTREDVTLGNTFFVSFPSIRDVWNSAFDGRALTLATEGGVAHIADIQRLDVDRRRFGIDALSLYRDKDVVYAGLRNGSVFRIDMRIKDRAESLLGQGDRDPVHNVSMAQTNQLFVGKRSGQLRLFDLRQMSESGRLSTAIAEYPDHVCGTSKRLGLAHDPDGRYLYAAGSDCRVRCWNMQTGQLLRAPPANTAAGSLLDSEFPCQVPAMCITTSTASGDTLQLAVGNSVLTYELGRKSLDIN